MSFGQYTIDANVGERLSYSVTIVLITVAQSIVTAGYLPICNEMLWLNFFNLISMIVTFFGIVETLLILFLLKMSNYDLEEEEMNKLVKKGEGETDESDERFNDSPNELLEENSKKSMRASKNKLVRAVTMKVENMHDLGRRIDLICVIILPVGYTIFIIVMFATNSLWDDSAEELLA